MIQNVCTSLLTDDWRKLVFEFGVHCYKTLCMYAYTGNVTAAGIDRVQALAYISRSALRCHSNETRAPIANPPNSAELEGTPTII